MNETLSWQSMCFFLALHSVRFSFVEEKGGRGRRRKRKGKRRKSLEKMVQLIGLEVMRSEWY